MATRTAAPLLRKVLAAADPGCGAAADRDLLRRFARDGDEAAFAALVTRHAPMVLAACRRVLGNPTDADDACQAAFLLLARKARDGRWQPSVAGWLYGAARRVSLNARRARARRARHEGAAGAKEPPNPLARVTGEELLAILDEELGRLPDSYREPLVLCGLEGLTRDEAAHRLGVPATTLKSRLERGRARLQAALSRRGIAVGAGLLALLVTSPAGAVSPGLLESIAAAAGGKVPARVAALAQGAAVSGGKLATACLLAAGLGFVGLLAGLRGLPPEATAAATPQAPPAPAAKPDAPRAPPAEAPDRIAGTVRGPDGKPLAGATLRVWTTDAKEFAALPPRATTAADGGFELTVTAAERDRSAVIVATADGLAPDWVKAADAAPGRPVTLKLEKDDLPVTGRVLSLEGQPLGGVTVEVVRVGKYTEGDDLKGWIDHHQKLRAQGYFYIRSQLNLLRPEACGRAGTFTTDAEGKVTLSGFGRNRVLWMKIRGETVETRGMKALTYPGPEEGFDPKHPGEDALFGNTFVQHIGPTKPIVGTIRDRKTGAPIAGAVVEDASGSYRAGAVTDANGRYRLVGLPKMSTYPIAVGGKPGVPYFDQTRHDVEDTAGLDPLTADFELDRGVEVTGRLTDRATGRPVAGEVRYFTRGDNPIAVARPRGGRVVGDWGTVRKDGTFRTLVDPGPGVLMAVASDPKPYPFVNINELFGRYGVNGFPSTPVQAVVTVDANESDPKSLTCDIALTPAVRLAGTVTDPDGKPLSGVRAAGLGPPDLSGLLRANRPEPDPAAHRLKTAGFAATGVHPDRPRVLVFAHPEAKLGKVFVAPTGERGPVTVRLEPLASASGRLLDASGKPLAGASVSVRASVRRSVADQFLPDELGFDRQTWSDVTARDAVTDAQGRFAVDGLLAGLPYRLSVKVESRDVSAGPDRIELTPGKTAELGDVKFDPAAPEAVE